MDKVTQQKARELVRKKLEDGINDVVVIHTALKMSKIQLSIVETIALINVVKRSRQ